MKRSYATKLVTIAVATSLIGIGLVTDLRADEAADIAAIEALWETYAASGVSADADARLGVWHEDGIQMPPGIPARGYDAVAKSTKKKKPGGTKAMTVTPEEIVILGDMAYSRGVYTATKVSNGADVEIDGKFLTIHKRHEDGSWRIYRDCFNSNTE
ncbi:nuclear transport factor 2 family protein [Tropicimonas sp. TH_r6]|uniref:YybH family protein n=1 Tax=Tropicimonas sp. TH_r6 TaxID=3082085 RepID=UPI002953BE8E|nr:nuclear transport factor 2 family protein [Tropicimonas sp. TH_r6]MDV7146008.1 nuclear transport factor 2 family protein [Tropicimonas sp. TH_r6]